MRLTLTQSSFAGGFLGKKYRNSTGSPLYKNSLDNGLNVLVTSQGKLIRRPSTEVLDNASNGTVEADSRQVPFAYTDNDAYRLIFEDDKITIYDNTDTVVNTIDPSGITGDQVSEFAYDQGRDRLIICHPDFGFKAVTRETGPNFTIADIEIEDGPYENLNLDSQKKLKPLATEGSSSIVAYLKDGTTQISDFFDTPDIGRLFRLRHSPSSGVTTWGVAKITNVVSPPNSTALMTVPTEYEFGAVSGVKNWRAGLWYPGFFPTAIQFGRGRLWGVRADRVNGSFLNDFERFSPTTANIFDDSDGHVVTDECAIDLQITNLKGEKLHWIYEDGAIHLGGENGHYTLQGASLLGSITPTTASVIQQSGEGAADIRPVSLDGLVYVHNSRKKLILSKVNWRTNLYDSTDLNALADTILDQQVSKILKVSYPWTMIWCILDNGDLACLTYDLGNEVAAWSLHRLATGQVVDGCVIKDPNGLDKLYFTVKQADDTYRVEKMSDFVIKENATGGDYIVCDGAYSFESTDPTGTISNLERWEGKTAYVMRNGTILQTAEIDGDGELTLNNIENGSLYIGINPEVYFETFDIESQSQEESSIGHKKQAQRIDIGLFDTGYLTVKQLGVESARAETVLFRTVDSQTEYAPELYTGVPEEFKPEQEDAKQLRFRFEQDKPAPLGISSLTFNLEVRK